MTNPSKPFLWGAIIQVHTVGPYAIIEYLEKVPVNRDDKTRRVMFHIEVEGKDAHRSYETLDAALAGAIAYRHEGPNGRAAEYFLRGIGAQS
jgi:hypothetical protein